MTEIPWEFLKYRYVVPILLIILDEKKIGQNALKHQLGAEYETVVSTIDFMRERGYVNRTDRGTGARSRYEFTLTPLGAQIAHIIKAASDQLLALKSSETSAPHNRAMGKGTR